MSHIELSEISLESTQFPYKQQSVHNSAISQCTRVFCVLKVAFSTTEMQNIKAKLNSTFPASKGISRQGKVRFVITKFWFHLSNATSQHRNVTCLTLLHNTGMHRYSVLLFCNHTFVSNNCAVRIKAVN